MTSAWQQAELWLVMGKWLCIVDRWQDDLDDAAVLRRFGHEALERRTRWLDGSSRAFDTTPPLIASSVAAALVEAGWAIDENGRTEFSTSHGAAREAVVNVGGGSLRISSNLDGLTTSELSKDLGAIEDRLLESASCA